MKQYTENFLVTTTEDGYAVVDFEGYMYFKSLIDNGLKSAATAFGKCIYFVCELSGELTKMRYAQIEGTQLVSAKYLRSLERKKIREQSKVRKLELRQKKREAESREARQAIQKEIDNVKELTKELTKDLMKNFLGPGELMAKKSFYVEPKIQKTPEQRRKDMQDYRVESQKQLAKEKAPMQDFLNKIKTQGVQSIFGDPSKFFDQEKFALYMKSEKGQAALKKMREEDARAQVQV